MAMPLLVVPQVLPEQAPGPMADARTPMRVQSETQGLDGWSGLGRGLMKAGAALDDIQEKQAVIYNEATVKEAAANYTDTVSKVLHDPDSGYMNMRGKNALGDSFDSAQKALQDAATEASSSLKNPRQQQMFQGVVQTQLAAAVSQMRSHASQQNQVYALDSSKARGNAAADGAVTSYNPVPGSDNSVFRQNVATQTIELNAQADQLGLSGDERDRYVKQGQAQLHVGVIDHLLTNNQTRAASEYLSSVREQMPPAIADKVAASLQVGLDQDNGLTNALAAEKQFPGDAGKQEEWLKEQFSSGKITEKGFHFAQSQVRTDLAMTDKIENDKRRGLDGQLADFYIHNPGASPAAVPKPLMIALQNAGIADRAFTYSAQSRKQGGGEDTTGEAFAHLMHQAGDPATRDAFASTDFGAVKGLSPGERRTLATYAAGIERKDTRVMDNATLFSGAVKLVKSDLQTAGLVPLQNQHLSADAAKAMDASASAFEAKAFEALETEANFRVENKQPPLRPEDAVKVLRGMLKDTVLSGQMTGGWFGTSLGAKPLHGPAFSVVDQIPDTERLQAMQALRASKVPPTPENILSTVNGARQRKAAAKPVSRPVPGAGPVDTILGN